MHANTKTKTNTQSYLNSLAYAHEFGVVLVDVIQKCLIMNATLADLYGGVSMTSASKEVSIQPFATSSILQHHYLATGGSSALPNAEGEFAPSSGGAANNSASTANNNNNSGARCADSAAPAPTSDFSGEFEPTVASGGGTKLLAGPSASSTPNGGAQVSWQRSFFTARVPA